MLLICLLSWDPEWHGVCVWMEVNACGSNSVVTMMLCCMQRGAFTSRDSNCILRPKNTRVWWTGSQNIHHLSSSATLVCVCGWK